jgi:glycosyltransferase involved in cell wall biosynthesis
MQEILLYIFIAVVAIQLLYYLGHLPYALSYSRKRRQTEEGVSVIVYVKNETTSLSQFLPSILSQDHSNFEIVLINDSYYTELVYDETLGLMKQLAEEHSHIKIVNVERNEAFWANKKYALTLGIKAASFENIVFTNLDCNPNSNQWLSTIASRFNKKKTVVLAYSNYKKSLFSIKNTFYRFEKFLATTQLFSFSKLGILFTGSHDNFGFKRLEFYEIGGFAGHMNIIGSEDELFINAIANKKNTVVCFSKKSHIRKNNAPNFGHWFTDLKLRNLNRKNFNVLHKFHLSLFSLTQLLFWILAIVCYFEIPQEQQHLLFTLIIARFGLQFIIHMFSAFKLKEWDLPILSPLLEPFLILLQMVIFMLNIAKQPTPRV